MVGPVAQVPLVSPFHVLEVLRGDIGGINALSFPIFDNTRCSLLPPREHILYPYVLQEHPPWVLFSKRHGTREYFIIEDILPM